MIAEAVGLVGDEVYKPSPRHMRHLQHSSPPVEHEAFLDGCRRAHALCIVQGRCGAFNTAAPCSST